MIPQLENLDLTLGSVRLLWLTFGLELNCLPPPDTVISVPLPCAYRLRDCGLTAGSCASLAKAFSSKSSASTLRHLNLSQNDIQDEGMKQLAEGTQHGTLDILE